MNDTSLLKNLSGLRTLSDLFTSENLARCVELMKRPTAIAIVASLGIHGLLGLSFPLLSSSPKDKQTPVKLVDLTPQEQSQLPPAAPAGMTLSPLTGATSLATTNPLADSLFKLPPNPPLSPFFNPSPANASLTPAPANNPLFSLPSRPVIISPDYFLNNAFKGTSQPTATPTATTSPAPPPTSTPTATPTSTPSPTTTPSPTPAELERAAKDQLARRVAGVRIAQQLALVQAGGGTSDSEESFIDRYAKWQNRLLAASQGRITPEDLARETTPYPEPIPPIECQRDACDGKSVIFVVAVDPEGQILGDPGVIRTTGDKALDQAATQVFLDTLLPKLQKPPAKNRTTLYAVAVDFALRKPS